MCDPRPVSFSFSFLVLALLHAFVYHTFAPFPMSFLSFNSFLFNEVLTSLLRLSYENVGWTMYKIRNDN